MKCYTFKNCLNGSCINSEKYQEWKDNDAQCAASLADVERKLRQVLLDYESKCMDVEDIRAVHAQLLCMTLDLKGMSKTGVTASSSVDMAVQLLPRVPKKTQAIEDAPGADEKPVGEDEPEASEKPAGDDAPVENPAGDEATGEVPGEKRKKSQGDNKKRKKKKKATQGIK